MCSDEVRTETLAQDWQVPRRSVQGPITTGWPRLGRSSNPTLTLDLTGPDLGFNWDRSGKRQAMTGVSFWTFVAPIDPWIQDLLEARVTVLLTHTLQYLFQRHVQSFASWRLFFHPHGRKRAQISGTS